MSSFRYAGSKAFDIANILILLDPHDDKVRECLCAITLGLDAVRSKVHTIGAIMSAKAHFDLVIGCCDCRDSKEDFLLV